MFSYSTLSLSSVGRFFFIFSYEKIIGTSLFLCSPISLKFELHAQITKRCDAFLDHGQQTICRQSEKYPKAAHCILDAELLPEARSRSLD